jgi:hypothetical protein
LPFLKASNVCNVELSQMQTLHAFSVLFGVGGALLLFATLGCGLSVTGQKRFKLPFVSVLLLAAALLGASAVFLRDPSRAADLHEKIDDLQAQGTRELYNDFGLLYSAGTCAPQGSGIVCEQCSVLTQALEVCVPGQRREELVEACVKQFAGTMEQCDAGCTKAFCDCADRLEETVQTDTEYLSQALVIAAAAIVVLACVACAVRKPVRIVAVYDITEPILPLPPSRPVQPRQPSLV